MNKKNYNIQEYFDFLLNSKKNEQDKILNVEEFFVAIKKENLGFLAQEIEELFYILDTKKDKVLDREEFVKKLLSISQPLYQLKHIIKTGSLEIEDIKKKMEINNDCFNFTLPDFKSSN